MNAKKSQPAPALKENITQPTQSVENIPSKSPAQEVVHNEISKETSKVNNLLSGVTKVQDIEKIFPGINKYYEDLKVSQRKLRNKNKKNRKKVRDQTRLSNLDPKSKDFVPILIKHYSLKPSDLIEPLFKYEGLTGDPLAQANLVNRSIIERSVQVRSQKFLQVDPGFFEPKGQEFKVEPVDTNESK